MFKRYLIFLFLFVSFAVSQYDYSLEDINSNSDFYGNNVGTSVFENQVTLHYFGHYN